MSICAYFVPWFAYLYTLKRKNGYSPFCSCVRISAHQRHGIRNIPLPLRYEEYCAFSELALFFSLRNRNLRNYVFSNIYEKQHEYVPSYLLNYHLEINHFDRSKTLGVPNLSSLLNYVYFEGLIKSYIILHFCSAKRYAERAQEWGSLHDFSRAPFVGKRLHECVWVCTRTCIQTCMYVLTWAHPLCHVWISEARAQSSWHCYKETTSMFHWKKLGKKTPSFLGPI